MTTQKRVYIFSNGSQYDQWERRNCARCTEADVKTLKGNCELFAAINEAIMGDCTFSAEIAQRLGDDGEYSWDCPERSLRA